MSAFKVKNTIFNEHQNRVFSDMGAILNVHPEFSIKKEGKLRSIFSRTSVSNKRAKFGVQSMILSKFKQYVRANGIKYYDAIIKEAQQILKVHGA